MTIEEYKELHTFYPDYIVGPNEFVIWKETIDDGETAWPIIYNQDDQWINYFTVPIPALQADVDAPVVAEYENIDKQ